DAAFVEFADRAREAVVVSVDDPGARRVASRLGHDRIVGFGSSATADVRVHDIRTDGPVSFAMTSGGRTVRARLPIPGEHNAINAAGAVAVLLVLGFDLEASVRAVERFEGTVRRFALHGVERGARVYDDYAHHPTEVAAALA